MLIGVVGKPSVGKSTFFKAATLAEVAIAPYPFTTIKPNEGVGFVRIEDAASFFGKVSNPRDGFVLGTNRFVPVQMLDVAGLVPGAHEGAGMGNQFLDDLRQADVLIHIIDIAGATNEKGECVSPGSYDPEKDLLFLEEELDYWYLRIMKKGWERFARQVQQERGSIVKELAKQLSALKVSVVMVEDVLKKLNLNLEQPISWADADLFGLAREFRKLTKPMIIACNKIDLPYGLENYDRLKQKYPHLMIVPCSAEAELALREAAKHGLITYVPGERTFSITSVGGAKLSDKQRHALDYIKTGILDVYGSGTGVQETINSAVFNLLKYVAIYPGGVNKLEDKFGNVLPDCFLMPPRTTALDFAFRLHTDFGNNFIRAIDVKTKRTVGKEHILNNGDVLEIVSGK
jgi:ribosome-binding ATPase YchF (GTP1/OBG family)